MSERINTPFTNEHFVAFCEKMVGQPYWYGSVVYKCSENLRARKAKQYPAHYGSSRTARYRDDIAKKKVCADCVGLIKGYNWTNGGQGVIESIGTDKTFSSRYGAWLPGQICQRHVQLCEEQGLCLGYYGHTARGARHCTAL